VKFAAVAGHRSGRATPSLRDAPQRQLMEWTGRESIYRDRNAVQTKPATSVVDLRPPLLGAVPKMILSRTNLGGADINGLRVRESCPATIQNGGRMSAAATAGIDPKLTFFRDQPDERSRLWIRLTRLVTGIVWFALVWTLNTPARRMPLAHGRFARRLPCDPTRSVTVQPV